MPGTMRGNEVTCTKNETVPTKLCYNFPYNLIPLLVLSHCKLPEGMDYFLSKLCISLPTTVIVTCPRFYVLLKKNIKRCGGGWGESVGKALYGHFVPRCRSATNVIYSLENCLGHWEVNQLAYHS